MKYQKLNTLLVLLFYIVSVAIAYPESVSEHTIDIHIPIAIPLDNAPFNPTRSADSTTPGHSVNNIYDQFDSTSDFNYAKTKHQSQTKEAKEDVILQEKSKKVGAEYLDKGKLYFRKVNKHSVDSIDLKKVKNHTSNTNSQTAIENHGATDQMNEKFSSLRTNSKELLYPGDITQKSSKETGNSKDELIRNGTKSKNKWRDKKHARNIINVLRTRKVKKSHHSNENDHIKENSNDVTYPEVSPVYIPNNYNHTDLNKTIRNISKAVSHERNRNSTHTDTIVYYPTTTATYDVYDGNYNAPEPKVPTEVYTKQHTEITGSMRESKSRRKHNPTQEQIKHNGHSNTTSTKFSDKSSNTVIEPYEPIVFRYEDYPFQANSYSRNNYSNAIRHNNNQQLQNRRQEEYENLLANDAKQQNDDYYGRQTKKHGKRGFKIISDLLNLVSGNNSPPPKRYRAHVIGSDGYVFEKNPFSSSQALSLTSQGLTLNNNPLSFTNTNNHNFGLTAFGSGKDFGQSFSIGSDGSLSLINGNHDFSTSGLSDSQKISFGTSANGDTFGFANLKDPKSQVESVYQGSNGQTNIQTGASENIRIVTKEVPVPYPVHVEKKVPYFIRVPQDRAVPYAVHKPYPVHITKPVPYPVKVHVPAPYPVTVEKHVPFPVRVSVPKPIAIHIPRPYPVYIEKKVPIAVDRPVPYPVKVPYEKPVPVHIPVEKPVPYPVTKHVPYPVKVPVDKPFPLTIPKPYPIAVEKPIRVPYKVPVPISINFPGKNEQFTTGIDHASNTGETTAFGANAGTTGGSNNFATNTGSTTAFGANLGESAQGVNPDFGNNNAQQNNFPQQTNYAQQNNFPQQTSFPQQNNFPQQTNFPQQYYSQENTNANYDSNNEGGFDYGDPSNLGFNNNADNIQNGFGNTGGGFDTQSTFGTNKGNIQADIPDINTIKVPEVNQNYQIYFDGTRQHKHKQTQDIFNEVNNVFDNLETKAVVPSFDQVGNIQNGRQFRTNHGKAIKHHAIGSGGTASFTDSHTKQRITHKFPSQSPVSQIQASPAPNRNNFNSNESSGLGSGEHTNGNGQFPTSHEYKQIDYTLLGGSFESRQSDSNQSSE